MAVRPYEEEEEVEEEERSRARVKRKVAAVVAATDGWSEEGTE